MKFSNKMITVIVQEDDLYDPILIGVVDGVKYIFHSAYKDSLGGRAFLKAVFDASECRAGICDTRPQLKVGDTWVEIKPPALPSDPKLLPQAIFERLAVMKKALLEL
ncbi:hypothetical protein [Pseudanabaena phage PA-SR01]|nr:hypothetical protein [Pseudanabaena phage PA-SR01]